jgi:hypothetical protein
MLIGLLEAALGTLHTVFYPGASILLITIAAIFKVYEIDQKYGPQQDGFLGKIDSIGKGNAEIIGVREGLFDQAAPLFGYFAEFLSAFFNLKCPRMQQGAEELEYFITVAVDNRVYSAQ